MVVGHISRFDSLALMAGSGSKCSKTFQGVKLTAYLLHCLQFMQTGVF